MTAMVVTSAMWHISAVIQLQETAGAQVGIKHNWLLHWVFVFIQFLVHKSFPWFAADCMKNQGCNYNNKARYSMCVDEYDTGHGCDLDTGEGLLVFSCAQVVCTITAAPVSHILCVAYVLHSFLMWCRGVSSTR